MRAVIVCFFKGKKSFCSISSIPFRDLTVEKTRRVFNEKKTREFY